MRHSISTLLIRILDDVFGEDAPTRRRSAIDEIFDEDAVYYDLNGEFRGRDEIDRIVSVIKASHPEFGYRTSAPPEELGNGGRLGWVCGRPGYKPSYAGTLFIIARDGRIAAVYLFYDKRP
jgi:hypothetical protein